MMMLLLFYLVKRSILLARGTSSISNAYNYLDNSLLRILTFCADLQKNKQDFLPPNLVQLPKKVFLLRRGPMLGLLLQHPDDIDFVRCLFLASDLDDAKLLMQPTIHIIQPDTGLTEAPNEDIILQNRNVIILDHFTDVFIWSGKDVVGAQYNSLREQCLRFITPKLQSRFPQPQIMQFNEGSSMARWLQCRLIPSHKDNINDQTAAYPEIANISKEKYSELMAKFHHTDDLSYTEYVHPLIKKATDDTPVPVSVFDN